MFDHFKELLLGGELPSSQEDVPGGYQFKNFKWTVSEIQEMGINFIETLCINSIEQFYLLKYQNSSVIIEHIMYKIFIILIINVSDIKINLRENNAHLDNFCFINK